MRADCPRILIAGDRSSSGKTTIVAGLLSALRGRGLQVQPFKVAMDYIDPSYHTWITGRSCRNLDGYLMTEGGRQGDLCPCGRERRHGRDRGRARPLRGIRRRPGQHGADRQDASQPR